MNATKNEHERIDPPIYQSPTITTYTSDQLLDLIGPVQAGSTGGDDNLLGIPGVGYYAPEDDGGERII